jgi:hypothetical protein
VRFHASPDISGELTMFHYGLFQTKIEFFVTKEKEMKKIISFFEKKIIPDLAKS